MKGTVFMGVIMLVSSVLDWDLLPLEAREFIEVVEKDFLSGWYSCFSDRGFFDVDEFNCAT